MAQHRDLIDYYNDDYLLLSDVMTPQALTENEVGYMVRLLEMTAGCRPNSAVQASRPVA